MKKTSLLPEKAATCAQGLTYMPRFAAPAQPGKEQSMSEPSDEIMERAEAILSSFIDSWKDDKMLIALAIMEAEARGRREGLEEAANVAEDFDWTGTRGDPWRSETLSPGALCDDIAAAIRKRGEVKPA